MKTAPYQAINPLAAPTPANRSTTGHSVFEAMLHATPLKSASDAYYWQHQTALQPSALTFQAACITPKIVVNEAATTSDPMSVVPTHPPKERVASSTQPITTSVLIRAPSNPVTPIPEQPHAAYNLNNHIEPRAAIDVHLPMITPNPKQASVPPLIWITHHHPFKSHHVFINEQGLEVALNTNGLSEHESRELQQTLKQAFAKTGYRLTRFIINGVQQ